MKVPPPVLDALRCDLNNHMELVRRRGSADPSLLRGLERRAYALSLITTVYNVEALDMQQRIRLLQSLCPPT